MTTNPQGSFVVPYLFSAETGAASVQQLGETVAYTGPIDYTYDLVSKADLLSQVFSFVETPGDATDIDVTADRAALGAFLTYAFDRATVNNAMAGDLRGLVAAMIDAFLTRAQEFGRDLTDVKVTPAGLAAAVQDVLAPTAGSPDAEAVTALRSMYEQAMAFDPDRVATGTALDPDNASDRSKITYRVGDKVEFIFNISFKDTPITVSQAALTSLQSGFSSNTSIAPTIPTMGKRADIRVKFRITLIQEYLKSLNIPDDSSVYLYNILLPGESLLNEATDRALLFGTDGSVKIVVASTGVVLWTAATAVPPANHTASKIAMQRDGKLVAYARASGSTADVSYWVADEQGYTFGVYLSSLNASDQFAITADGSNTILWNAGYTAP